MSNFEKEKKNLLTVGFPNISHLRMKADSNNLFQSREKVRQLLEP